MKNKTETAIRTAETLFTSLPSSFLNVMATTNNTLFIAFFSSLKKKH